jgi:hypothetical protein
MSTKATFTSGAVARALMLHQVTTSASINYAKQRLISSINDSVYESSAGKTYSAAISNAEVAAGTVTITTSAPHGLVLGNKVTVLDLPAPLLPTMSQLR